MVEIVVVLSFVLCNSPLIHKFFHAGKTICADRLKEIVENNECLIYSFGNPTTNLTFELAMLKIGCTVKMGFSSKIDLRIDEAVKKLAFEYDKLFYFKNVELSHKNSREKNLKTFKKILKDNEDLGKNIFFVNLDLDGNNHHLLMKDWFTSDVLRLIKV